MINVDEIFNGFVLDHIQAGRSMAIYHYLNLDENGKKGHNQSRRTS